MAESRLLSIADVTDRTTLSRSEVYRRCKENKFPAPVPLGKQRVAWVESEIDDFIESLKKNRPSTQINSEHCSTREAAHA